MCFTPPPPPSPPCLLFRAALRHCRLIRSALHPRAIIVVFIFRFLLAAEQTFVIESEKSSKSERREVGGRGSRSCGLRESLLNKVNKPFF
nr:hypothetical protein Iba_chr01dCG5500 [Ipomoea batatas]